jgi:hypothetical protein
MSKVVKRELILAKLEGVGSYGVDATPTEAANAILVEEIAFGNEGLRKNDRSGAIRATFSKLKKTYGGSLKAIGFNVEIKGSGAAGTPPELGPLLVGAGFSETINAGVSVVYDPASSGHDSPTIYYFKDGSRHRLVGCRGNVSLSAEVGGRLMLSFSFIGHQVAGDPTDVALPMPTLATLAPPSFLVNNTFLIGAYAPKFTTFSFDMGNQLAMPGNVNALDGYGEIQIVDRAVTGSFNPEEDLVANFDPQGDLEADTEYALTTGAIGGTAGNRVQIDMPKITFDDVSDEDSDGIRRNTIPFMASDSSGDDEVTITFT